MCKLIEVLASSCRHPLSFHYEHCVRASYPRCCKSRDSAVDGYLFEKAPLCESCWNETEANMYAEFHEERREMTKAMRAEHLEDEEISAVRKHHRNLFYQRLKAVNKPLPALSADASTSSDTSSDTVVAGPERDLNTKGLYLLGGNPPMEVRREDKLIIGVGQEKWPRGPI